MAGEWYPSLVGLLSFDGRDDDCAGQASRVLDGWGERDLATPHGEVRPLRIGPGGKGDVRDRTYGGIGGGWHRGGHP